ncbi:hypothetical protein [Streptomyces sp. NPDC006645]|uniref:hypothetical protein n=1 Tax=unclassified Streptomyces TaxID=2593676 RepID=UPI0033A075E7
MTYDAKEPGKYDPKESGKESGEKAAGKEERVLRSERGSRPVTPVVPLSETEGAAATTGTGAGSDVGSRPARPTAPPPTPPLTAPATPATSAAGPATAPRTARGKAEAPEKDPLAGPVQDPVHPVHTASPTTTSGSAATSARETASPATSARETSPTTTSGPATTSARETAPGRAPETAPPQAPRLIPQDESDKLNLRLQEALSTFIDGPRRSVEEAADVLEEATKRLTAALAERPRALRDSWDTDGTGGGKSSAGAADTEDLRLALRSYREVTERLLRI